MLWLVFFALGGVVAWQFAVAGSAKKLECPSCDLYIVGALPKEGESVLCSNCREFALYQGKALVKPAPDHVAAAPVYCAELPISGLRWPASCCACTEPAARTVRVQLRYEQDASLGSDMATRFATLGMFKLVDQHTISLEVPHCAQHGDGASLVMPYEKEQPNFGIAFRSYPYFTEFVRLNRSTPRKATMFGGQREVV